MGTGLNSLHVLTQFVQYNNCRRQVIQVRLLRLRCYENYLQKVYNQWVAALVSKPKHPSWATHNIIQPFVNATNIVIVCAGSEVSLISQQLFILAKQVPGIYCNCPIWQCLLSSFRVFTLESSKVHLSVNRENRPLLLSVLLRQ